MTSEEEKISSIYQQGKEQGPSADMDHVILKAAHEAVAQPTDKTSTVKGPFSGGWRARATIAAVLLITVILVPLIEQQETRSPDFDGPDMVEPDSSKQEEKIEFLKERDSVSRLKAKQQVTVAKPLPSAQKEARKTAQEADVSKKRSLRKSPALMFETKQKPKLYQYSSDALEMESEAKKPMPASSPASLSADAALSDDLDSDDMDSDDMDSETIVLLSAEKWMEKIRHYLDKGEFDNAQIELDSFKKNYPHEVIDPMLIQRVAERI